MWSVGRFSYPLTREQLKSFQTEYEEKPDGFRLAAVLSDGSLAGQITFRQVDYQEDYAYIGFIVIDPLLRGQGMGHKMIAKVVGYAFDVLGVSCVRLGVLASNDAAIHCYKAVGFKLEEIKADYVTYNEESWDLYQIAIRKE
ncbi:acetyltransferase [Lachnospiraceae bacterium KM106-2]|nr:acetyltransferase [Lachnospiraceae bacterium KM106-2]